MGYIGPLCDLRGEAASHGPVVGDRSRRRPTPIAPPAYADRPAGLRRSPRRKRTGRSQRKRPGRGQRKWSGCGQRKRFGCGQPKRFGCGPRQRIRHGRRDLDVQQALFRCRFRQRHHRVPVGPATQCGPITLDRPPAKRQVWMIQRDRLDRRTVPQRQPRHHNPKAAAFLDPWPHVARMGRAAIPAAPGPGPPAARTRTARPRRQPA